MRPLRISVDFHGTTRAVRLPARSLALGDPRPASPVSVSAPRGAAATSARARRTLESLWRASAHHSGPWSALNRRQWVDFY